MATRMGSTKGSEIIVVDDRRLEGEAIAAYLSGSGLDARTVSLDSFEGLLPGNGLALVSLGTAGRGDHVARLAALCWQVVVYGSWDEFRVARAVSDGAVGFISGESRVDELEAEVRSLLAGRGRLDATERERLTELALEETHTARGLASLTPRESDVLDALLTGRRTADIAADSYVSVTTVRNQVQSILTKLNVHSQLEAVAAARRHGWGVLDTLSGE
ncbi:MAG TPA: response regulator transcription factor [Acidimicrobiia bacterium]|nr:response regulator transcription factor [Acidimicrobiia bacterium]